MPLWQYSPQPVCYPVALFRVICSYWVLLLRMAPDYDSPWCVESCARVPACPDKSSRVDRHRDKDLVRCAQSHKC